MTGFQTTHAFSGFSVDDIDAARAFYGDTLGLEVTTNAMGFLDIRLPQGGSILVYAKPNHTPASFTILNFPVDDVEAAVDDLNARGVVTKIYTDPDFGTDAKGIAHGAPAAARTSPGSPIRPATCCRCSPPADAAPS